MSRSNKFRLSIGNVQYSVDVNEKAHGIYEVKVNDEIFKVSIADLMSPMSQSMTGGGVEGKAAGTAAGPPAGGSINAAMPGTVMTVKCKVGDTANVGDVLLTLETMKMENPIKSSKVGKIKEIKVTPGKFVNVGDTLIIME